MAGGSDLWPGVSLNKRKRTHGNMSHWHLHSEKDLICQWFNPLIPRIPARGDDNDPLLPGGIPDGILSFNRYAGTIGMVPKDFMELIDTMDIHLEGTTRKNLSTIIHNKLRRMSVKILQMGTDESFKG
jgi:hypothetical protein